MAFVLIHFDDCEDRQEMLESIREFTDLADLPMVAVLVPLECEEAVETLYERLEEELEEEES